MTRRALFSALAVLITPRTVTAQPGFFVTGELTATPAEQLEGYAQIGNEFGLSAHPKGAAYHPLMNLVGKTVRVHVETVE